MNLSRAGRAASTNSLLHQRVRDVIRDCGFQYEEEYRIRGTYYVVDFYLPEFHLAVEADAPFHKKNRDAFRDEIIFKNVGVLVFRINKEHLDFDLIKTMRKLVEFCEEHFVTMEERLIKEYNGY